MRQLFPCHMGEPAPGEHRRLDAGHVFSAAAVGEQDGQSALIGAACRGVGRPIVKPQNGHVAAVYLPQRQLGHIALQHKRTAVIALLPLVRVFTHGFHRRPLIKALWVGFGVLLQQSQQRAADLLLCIEQCGDPQAVSSVFLMPVDGQHPEGNGTGHGALVLTQGGSGVEIRHGVLPQILLIIRRQLRRNRLCLRCSIQQLAGQLFRSIAVGCRHADNGPVGDGLSCRAVRGHLGRCRGALQLDFAHVLLRNIPLPANIVHVMHDDLVPVVFETLHFVFQGIGGRKVLRRQNQHRRLMLRLLVFITHPAYSSLSSPAWELIPLASHI